MTALTDLTRDGRRRLAARMRELDELVGMMRERGGLPTAPEPPPLHRAACGTKTFSAESTKNFSTNPTERTVSS